MFQKRLGVVGPFFKSKTAAVLLQDCRSTVAILPQYSRILPQYCYICAGLLQPSRDRRSTVAIVAGMRQSGSMAVRIFYWTVTAFA